PVLKGSELQTDPPVEPQRQSNTHQMAVLPKFSNTPRATSGSRSPTEQPGSHLVLLLQRFLRATGVPTASATVRASRGHHRADTPFLQSLKKSLLGPGECATHGASPAFYRHTRDIPHLAASITPRSPPSSRPTVSAPPPRTPSADSRKLACKSHSQSCSLRL